MQTQEQCDAISIYLLIKIKTQVSIIIIFISCAIQLFSTFITIKNAYQKVGHEY
jgi:uncharacterized membrane protein YqhA